MLKAQTLIQSGYFPFELPPPFQTTDFANYLNLFPITKLNRLERSWVKKSKTNIPASKSCSFSVPRVKNLRRNLSIPNPFYQLILCYQIEKNWAEIKTHITNSPLSISRPNFPITQNRRNRSFDLVMDFVDIDQEIAIKSTEFRYLLKADISRFYDTIYTHSISWALHTKEIAKRERNNKSLSGNQLDRAVQKTRDGQTLGIPIGPDSSIIISEIIATSVDLELQSQMDTPLKGIRIIDDYFLFFREIQESEQALGKFQKILKNYELEINPKKIKIAEVPHILEPAWKPAIRQFIFRLPDNPANNIITQRTDLINFFSRVNEYCLLFPDDNVLKYGIKRIKEKKIYEENIPLYESLLLKSMLIQSSCIPNVIEIILSLKNFEYEGKNNKIGETISELIRFHSKYSNDFEIAWTLWLAKEMNFVLENDVVDILSKNDNPIVSLIILDMRNIGLIRNNIDDETWSKYLVKEQLYDDHWLLTYEAIIKGWLSSSENFIDEDPFFGLLKDNNVSFYNGANAEIITIPGSGVYTD